MARIVPSQVVELIGTTSQRKSQDTLLPFTKGVLMEKGKLVIHESEGEIVPDICGTAIEMVNSSSGATKLSFAKLIIRPGEKSRLHYHRITEEIYYILSGCGKIQIDNEIFAVRTGHAILLPLGARHQIINDEKQDLIFVCADAPVFDPNDVIEL